MRERIAPVIFRRVEASERVMRGVGRTARLNRRVQQLSRGFDLALVAAGQAEQQIDLRAVGLSVVRALQVSARECEFAFAEEFEAEYEIERGVGGGEGGGAFQGV